MAMLALAYGRFVKQTIDTGASEKFGPMGYA
jgi:hypothetical protein